MILSFKALSFTTVWPVSSLTDTANICTKNTFLASVNRIFFLWFFISLFFSSKPTYTTPSNTNPSPSKSLSEKHSSQLRTPRSPQLSVTGFRSDMYNVNSSSSTISKPALPVTRMKSSVAPVTTAHSNSSSHLMKQARTKQHHNFRLDKKLFRNSQFFKNWIYLHILHGLKPKVRWMFTPLFVDSWGKTKIFYSDFMYFFLFFLPKGGKLNHQISLEVWILSLFTFLSNICLLGSLSK